MTVQVNYTNKDKSSDLGVIVLFADEKFQIKNIKDFFSKNETSYFERILKNKKNTKDSIISFNINEKSTVILISIKKNLKGSNVENLGALFYDFIKNNRIIFSKLNKIIFFLQFFYSLFLLLFGFFY